MKKFALAFVLPLLPAMTFSAQPKLSAVAYNQPENSRRVNISFTLENGPAIVTAMVRTNSVALGASELSTIGLNQMMTSGVYNVVWQPARTLGEFNLANGEVELELKAYSPRFPPQYMVVDLESSSNVHYYATQDELPGGIDSRRYRTGAILMKRMEAAAVKWRMGAVSTNLSSTLQAQDALRFHETPRFTTLTNDYYIGVFEITQAQFARFYGSNLASFKDPSKYPDWELMPVESTSADAIRGRLDYGVAGHRVSDSSAMGKLRRLTGVQFDLPTEAQWEFACRGGSTASFCCHSDQTSDVTAYGWMNFTGKTEVFNREFPMPVGLKTPNGYGLYDMHGNVFELTLDYYSEYDESPRVDHVATDTSSGYLVMKGGSYNYGSTACTAAAGRKIAPGTFNNYTGFRVVAPFMGK